MKLQAFLQHRAEELRKFYFMRFGRHWRTRVAQRLGYRWPPRWTYPKAGGLRIEILLSAESLALQLGFRPRLPLSLPVERKKFERFEAAIEQLNLVVWAPFARPTVRDVLRVLRHRQRFRLLRNSVIGPVRQSPSVSKSQSNPDRFSYESLLNEPVVPDQTRAAAPPCERNPSSTDPSG
jgi:hypothetical protein